MHRARWWLVGGAALAVVTAAVLIRWAPALAVTIALGAPSTESWVAGWLGAVARDDVVVPAGPRMLPADVYRRSGDRRPEAALLLIHGLSPAGRRQPDLARLARLLAGAGPVVVVPQLDGLASFRLTGREVADVAASLRHARTLAGRVGIAGFSVGAGPALLAAADARDVALVASFGGYAEIETVVVFVATGAHRFAGARHVQGVEPFNRWKLAALLAPFVVDDDDRQRLDRLVAAKLANPGADTSALEASLGGDGRRTLALALARDEAEARRLLATLPAPARAALHALSPLPVVSRVPGRLLIAHGADDPSIPFTESLRLADASEGRAEAVILRGFHHTGPAGAWRALADAWRLLMLVDALIACR